MKASATIQFVALALGAGLLIGPGSAWAAEAAAAQMRPAFPVSQLFTLLFLMLGPIKIIHPFLQATRGADAALTRKIALLSTLFASVALLIAAFLGESVLSRYGIPLPVMALAGGIILFLVALQGVLAQFAPVAADGEATASAASKPTLKLALSPIAFPTIVTPYGIAALVVFLAVSPDLQSQLVVGAVLLMIMLLNLVTMLVAARLLPVLAITLPILGAVFGVIQVAVGLQIIHNALGTLGIL
jgi:multiple antibiotic resistance protein